MTDVLTLACSTCRATFEKGGGEAAGWSIFFLLVVIVGLLGIIGFSMFRLARRAKLHHDPGLSDECPATGH